MCVTNGRRTGRTLAVLDGLAELGVELGLGEATGLALEHGDDLVARHLALVAERNEVIGEDAVVLAEEAQADHDEVDVLEDERALGGVAVAGGERRTGVVAPMAARVEVVALLASAEPHHCERTVW